TQYYFTDDGRRNIQEIVDPASRHTKFIYNYSDLVTERDDPDPVTGLASTAQAWHFTYDANGDLTSLKDPLTNITGYIFDGADHLYQLFEPNPAGSGTGLMTRYDRDEHGMVETMTDPMNNV